MKKSTIVIFIFCFGLIVKISAQNLPKVLIKTHYELTTFENTSEVEPYGIDNIIFPEATVKKNQIRRLVVVSYGFTKKNTIAHKKLRTEIYDFSINGDLLSYKESSKGDKFKITVLYNSDSSVISVSERHDDTYYKFTQRKKITDSGLLIMDTMTEMRADRKSWTFLISHPNEKTEKVVRFSEYEPNAGYYKIKTDSGYIYQDLHEVDDIMNCFGKFNHDSSTYCSRCVGDVESMYLFEGFSLPPKQINLYKAHKLIAKIINNQYKVVYNDEEHPCALLRKTDHDTSFCAVEHSLNYEKGNSLPISKIYYNSNEHKDTPEKYSRYYYEFYK